MQRLIACSSTNKPTESNIKRGDEVIRLKKEGTIDTENVTQAQKSNYWRGIREDKVVKRQQQGLEFPNIDNISANKEKPFIPYKYKNKI